MNFSIIIVNYNLSKEISICLDSIYKNLNTTDFEIIIFDNNSDETSLDLIKRKVQSINSKNITLILNDKNIGFGQACNQAVLKASGKILFFLNPDTLVLENLFYSIQSEFGKEVFSDHVVGLNVHKHFAIDNSAGLFPNLFLETCNIVSLGRIIEAFYIKVLTYLNGRKKIKVDWVMGAAFFIPKELFVNIGGFDSDYFLYFEELDLFKRIKDKGYDVYYFPTNNVLHDGSVSTKKNYYFFTKLFYKGKLIFLQKHSSTKKFTIFKFLLQIHFIFQVILWNLLKSKFPDKANGKLKAFKELRMFVSDPINISNSST
ncbi:MAG: glycosyltransferase family 2 protein [Ignavibacterium sp.]|jgi:GT2 family glycosyltransferase|nr:glycosyltransferase family 2 protein [Ignavibacterium sp.]